VNIAAGAARLAEGTATGQRKPNGAERAALFPTVWCDPRPRSTASQRENETARPRSLGVTLLPTARSPRPRQATADRVAEKNASGRHLFPVKPWRCAFSHRQGSRAHARRCRGGQTLAASAPDKPLRWRAVGRAV